MANGTAVLEKRLSALELLRGTAHVLEALSFATLGGAHSQGKRRLHMDLGPHNIWITPDGQWRVGGWGFSLDLDAAQQTTPCPYFLQASATATNPPVGPRLTYAAPELTEACAPGGGPAGLTPRSVTNRFCRIGPALTLQQPYLTLTLTLP